MEYINSLKIKIARKARRLSMDELVVRMGGKAISKMSISKIERGLLRPSRLTLQAIADACEVPVSFFYGDSVNVGDLDFRFTKNTPTKNAEHIRAGVIAEIQKYFMHENLIPYHHTKFKPLRRGIVRSYDDVEDAAIFLRKKWEMGCQPIFSVYELLSIYGVRIIELEIDDENVIGLSTFVNDVIPVVIINSKANVTTERKRFTALHEFAHLLLRINPLSEDEHKMYVKRYDTLPYKVTVKPPTVERLCNYFASAMLLPKDSLYSRIGNMRIKLSILELISIRNMYGISIAATVHRAHDLAIIDDIEYDRLYDNFINKNIMEERWGTFPIMETVDRLMLLEERIKTELQLINE